MKRILTVAALAAAAVIPATSSADSAGEATADRGGTDLRITFVLRSLGGEPKQIRRFEFKRFTVACNTGGPVEVKGEIRRMNVNDAGKFDGNAKKGDGKVHVEGEVKNGGNKVVGTLKASGKFGAAEGCDTKVGWEAS